MKIDRYKLLDLDHMEASIVRRRLRRWTKADEEAIRPLIASMQQASCLDGVDIVEPRYETSVYPLYYYWAHLHGVRHKDLGEYMFREFAADTSMIDKAQLLPQVSTLVSTEIDILIEDAEYFAFIEAKETKSGRKATFQKQGGVHQLVRQYAQGCALERLINKKFAFATIGANNAQTLEIRLNPVERALLRLVSEDTETLKVVDISWPDDRR
jgi:hypothetical protein